MIASRTEIVTLIQQGSSNSAIARELHCDKARAARIRRELGLPNAVRQPLTLEEKWAARTRPLDGGHLEWLGEHVGKSGTPVMHYREVSYTATAIAFRIRTGRNPVGYAIAECGHHHCVAPAHVEDDPGRQKAREQLRYLTGGQQRPERCAHGHDQAEHGRYSPTGGAYCGACNHHRKQREQVSC
ncbi:hypothetical protein V2S66_03110 [Streptomyces sp. V4-01]|uniref:Uncharacterized protein n=1 Tax=Actinacidiphila polyblastidii TaxID=3110430 RepID=A0ABU7P594_9ACTN|nr:hypothetical protein [Streptomyces sp. V4-01]